MFYRLKTQKVKNRTQNYILNVPNLRFPGFEGEWKEVNLSTIATFFKGKGISKEHLSESGSPCILYGELYTKYKSEVIDDVVSRTALNSKDLVKGKTNDVLIPSSGETAIDIATARCVNIEGVLLGGDLNVIRPYKDSGSFISYQLNGKRKKDIAKLAQGSSVTHLYNGSLKKMLISLPKRDEQEKISELLGLIGARISTQSKIIGQLKTSMQNLREKLLNQKLTFKNAAGDNFPAWEMKTLDDICKIVMGQSPNSTSYNSENVGIPLIQGNADIFNRKTKPRNWTTEPTKNCSKGDLILTVRAPVGAVAKSLHNACIGRGVCAIKEKSENSLEFIYQFLLDFEDKWASFEQGSTFTAVSGSEIKRIKITTPIFSEQIQIAKFLFSLDEKIETENKILDKYEKQKKYLLSNLFI